MARFVPQQPQPPERVAAVDVAHHLAFELPQPRVGHEKRDRDARRAVRRKPFFGQPHVRFEADAAPFEFAVQRVDFGFDETVGHAQVQVAQAQREQSVIVEIGPAVWGRIASSIGAAPLGDH